jgi:hypothetical protein
MPKYQGLSLLFACPLSSGNGFGCSGGVGGRATGGGGPGGYGCAGGPGGLGKLAVGGAGGVTTPTVSSNEPVSQAGPIPITILRTLYTALISVRRRTGAMIDCIDSRTAKG